MTPKERRGTSSTAKVDAVDVVLFVMVAAVVVAVGSTLIVTRLGSPPPAVVASPSNGSGSSVIPPLDVVPVDPMEPEVPSTRSEANGPSDPAPSSVAATAVTGGGVSLQRIGFSFVTGGPGACGVTLQAWTHVAVSRELLDDLGCGARVRIDLDEPVAGRSTVEAIVADTMNPSFERTVNVYVGRDEPAQVYGLTTGRLTN